MGSLAQIAKSFDGSSDELEAQKEVIQTLSALAESRLEVFRTKVDNSYLTAGTEGNPTFPIEAVMRSWSKTHAYSENSATQLSAKLKEATQSFMGGGGDGISDGIFKIVDAALIALFVDSVASEGSDELYFIYCKDDVVTRLDMCSWYRNVSATAITRKMQKSSCFLIRQASINCKRVPWYSFISVVKSSYGTLGLDKAAFDAAVAAAERDYVKGGGVIPPNSSIAEVEPHQSLSDEYRMHIKRKVD